MKVDDQGEVIGRLAREPAAHRARRGDADRVPDEGLVE